MTNLTGHVGAVYMVRGGAGGGECVCTRSRTLTRTLRGAQVAWSPDSRMLATASKDQTVKVWSLASPKRALHTLPGHADEVYALDWAPTGQRVASGSKDRIVKL